MAADRQLEPAPAGAAGAVGAPARPVLEVRHLVKRYPARGSLFGPRRWVSAVEDVSFSIAPGQTFGLVGESGCGKSTTGKCIMRLVEPTAGQVLLEGTDLLALAPRALQPYRRLVQMVFQNPYASLDPRMTVERIVAEPLRTHRLVPSHAIRGRVLELLEAVGLGAAHLGRYPHQFSGGQRQRIGLARALATNPRLLIADEPVSALDVSIQAQIIGLMQDLQERFHLSMLFISHNLSVVKYLSNQVGVMYLGEIVESGPAATIFASPRHPYTRALLSAVPEPSVHQPRERIVLEGDVPSPLNPPAACRFHTRCPFAEAVCRQQRPPLVDVGGGQQVRCHLVAQGRL